MVVAIRDVYKGTYLLKAERKKGGWWWLRMDVVRQTSEKRQVFKTKQL